MKIKWVILFLLFCNTINAQQSKFLGIWQGTLQVGMDLRIVFHYNQNSSGHYYAVMDSPDQAAFGISTDTAFEKGDSIYIRIKKANISYAGQLKSDSLIEGIFTQGQTFPLTLKKVDHVEKAKSVKRPQTPKPPYAYLSEEVVYTNADNSLKYGATITTPQGKGPFPGIVLITGSGAQNRDEEIFQHKPFALLADYLTKIGFMVLRVDDRGVGKSTGNFSTATSEDFANDVQVSMEYLKNRSGIDTNRIGLLGHSEGGMIAPMIAAKRNDIQFIILLAGPGIPVIDLMTEQNLAIFQKQGISGISLSAYGKLFKNICLSIVHSSDNISAVDHATKVLKDWLDHTDSSICAELNLTGKDEQINYVNSMVKEIMTPWYKYFLSYNPQPALQQLKCKVLAVNGDKDIQVLSSTNLEGIRNSLKSGHSPVYDIKELKGLNHLFQQCNICTIQEYGQLEETLSPTLLETIGTWLKKHIL